jgi:hypothetical protein
MPDELLTENVWAMVENLLEQGKFAAAATLVAKWLMASSCKGDEHGSSKSPEDLIEETIEKMLKQKKITPEGANELREAMNGEFSFAETVRFLTKVGIEIPKGALQDFFEPEVPLYLRNDKNNSFEPAEKRVPALFAIIDQGLQEVAAGRMTGEQLNDYVIKIIRNLERMEELLPEGKKVERDFINDTVEKDGKQISVLDLLQMRREELLDKNDEQAASKVKALELLEDELRRRGARGYNPTPAEEEAKNPKAALLEKFGPKSLDGLKGVNQGRGGARHR